MTLLATISCVVCLIHFASGQADGIPPCVNDTLRMSGEPECARALDDVSSPNSTLIICNETCRGVLDDVMRNCGEVSYLRSH